MPAIVCSGCGRVFDPPAGYRRNKIQCPDCGVICPVPEGAVPPPTSGVDSSPPPAERRSSRRSGQGWYADPMPDPIPNTEPMPELLPELAPEPRPEKPRPTPASRPSGATPIPAMELEEDPIADEESVGNADDEDDDSPYILRDKLGPTCPKCRSEMQSGARVCVKCGYNRATRQKAKRRYEPMEREWESDRSLMTRIGFFAAAQAFHFSLGLLCLMFFDTFMPAIIAWFPMTGLLLFILGTYDHIRLTRDTKGRVKLIKTWRFAFVPLVPEVTNVRGYEGVVSGPWHEAGFLEWGVLIALLFWGLIPGFIWYWNAIHTPQYMVALARDHGNPEVYVYRGRNATQMNDIADTLAQMAELRRLG